MWRSTEVGARENKMSEYIGHGSGMWRSTGIAAGDNKMIRVHGKSLLVMLSDYFYTYHMQTNTGTASFLLSRSIHKGDVSYLVLLHLESALSLYNMISILVSCMIRSTTSATFLGRCPSTFA